MAKSKIHKKVLHEFINKLMLEDEFDNEMAEKLLKILATDDKIKPADLISIFCKEDVIE